MKNINGFTLVELLVAYAITLILLFIAVPAFHQFNLNNRRAAQVNEFVRALTFARTEAIVRGYRVSLCRTDNYADTLPTCGRGKGWEDGWIIFKDKNKNNQPDDEAEIIKVHGELSGDRVKLRGNKNVENRIVYTAQGRVAGSIGTVTWCDQRGAGLQAREISFPLSGRIKTRKGDGQSQC